MIGLVALVVAVGGGLGLAVLLACLAPDEAPRVQRIAENLVATWAIIHRLERSAPLVEDELGRWADDGGTYA